MPQKTIKPKGKRCSDLSSQNISMPKIPRAFISNPHVCRVLYSTIEEFNFEEKTVIYLYCFAKLTVDEIADLTELSALYIVSTLTLYSERMSFKLGVFERAVHHSTDDLISMQEVFEMEAVKEIMELEFNKYYFKWQQKNSYAVI